MNRLSGRIVATATLVALLTGCGAQASHQTTASASGTKSGTKPSASPVAPSPSGTTSSPKALTDEQLVRSIGLSPANIPAGYRTRNIMRDGETVVAQVTLSLCGASFASERLRTARHQVAYRAGRGDGSVSTETVAYRSGGAQQAMSEVRHSIATCPTGFVDSGIEGVPPTKQRFTPLALQPDWEPGTVAVRMTQTSGTGQSATGILIYQRRGNVLSGTYVWPGNGPAVTVADHIASLIAGQLNAAPIGSGPTT